MRNEMNLKEMSGRKIKGQKQKTYHKSDMRVFFAFSNQFLLSVDKLPSLVWLTVEICAIFWCLFLFAKETEALLAASLFAVFVAHGHASALARAGRHWRHGHRPTQTSCATRRTLGGRQG